MQTSRITRVSALELTMRDVLDGLDDFACEFAYSNRPGEFEILAIEPPSPDELEDCAA